MFAIDSWQASEALRRPQLLLWPQNIDTDQIIPAEYLTLVPSKVRGRRRQRRLPAPSASQQGCIGARAGPGTCSWPCMLGSGSWHASACQAAKHVHTPAGADHRRGSTSSRCCLHPPDACSQAAAFTTTTTCCRRLRRLRLLL